MSVQEWMFNESSGEFGEGIHLRSRRGPIGVSWWSRKWMELVEEKVDPQELEVGRRLARRSVVLECEFVPGLCRGRVAESKDIVGAITIQFPVILESGWDRILEAITKDALAIARIYARKMPDNIEDILAVAGAQLIPERMPVASCSCDSALNICRHTVALACAMAERFDDQPSHLLHLLGKSQTQVCNAIRASWDLPPLRHTEEENRPPKLANLLDSFYRGEARLPENMGTVELNEVEALECLGYPPFFPPSDRSVMQTLRDLYGE
jgi:uncharacterized Zn finger protein